MYHKGISIALSLGMLTVGFLWYLAEKGYEPIVVMITALISLVSSLFIFSPNFKNQSTREKEGYKSTDPRQISKELIISSKKYDNVFSLVKSTISTIAAILSLITFFYITIFILEIKDLPVENLSSKLINDQFVTSEYSETMSTYEIWFQSFILTLRENSFFNTFFAAAIVLLFAGMAPNFLRSYVLKKYKVKIQQITESSAFIKECENINQNLMHHEFKNKDSPELLKLSIIQAFANIHLKHL